MNRGTLKKVLTWGFAILFIVLIFAASWLAMCGIIKLVTLCFDLQFKWAVATGIWLILVFITPFLRPRVTVKK